MRFIAHVAFSDAGVSIQYVDTRYSLPSGLEQASLLAIPATGQYERQLTELHAAIVVVLEDALEDLGVDLGDSEDGVSDGDTDADE